MNKPPNFLKKLKGKNYKAKKYKAKKHKAKIKQKFTLQHNRAQAPPTLKLIETQYSSAFPTPKHETQNERTKPKPKKSQTKNAKHFLPWKYSSSISRAFDKNRQYGSKSKLGGSLDYEKYESDSYVEDKLGLIFRKKRKSRFYGKNWKFCSFKDSKEFDRLEFVGGVKEEKRGKNIFGRRKIYGKRVGGLFGIRR